MTDTDLFDAWTTWLATDAPRRVSPTTITSYRRQAGFVAAWLAAELAVPCTPATITPARLESYLDDLQHRHQRKPATINLAIAVAADMLGHASLTTTRRYVKASAAEGETAVDQLYRSNRVRS